MGMLGCWRAYICFGVTGAGSLGAGDVGGGDVGLLGGLSLLWGHGGG